MLATHCFASRAVSRPEGAAARIGIWRGRAKSLSFQRTAIISRAEAGQAPWQVAPQPVYAVGSFRPDDGVSNLSIATYVTAASISKGQDENKRYVVCLFKDSVTHGIVSETRQMSLSLLCEHPGADQLVELLGKTHHSPDNNKLARLETEMGIRCDTELWDGLPLLPSRYVLGVMQLSVHGVMDAGDHDVFLCDVERLEQLSRAGGDAFDPQPLLTTWLKKKGVL